MELFIWEFRNFKVPMISDEEHGLLTVTPVLAGALKIPPQYIRGISHDHSEKLSHLSVGESNAKGFLLANKEAFGLSRVRNDGRLWTIRDMIYIAFYSRSQVAADFQADMIELVESHAKVTRVSPHMFQKLLDEHMETARRLELAETELERTRDALADTQDRLEGLEKRVSLTSPALEQAGSAFGKGLSLQKQIKSLRRAN